MFNLSTNLTNLSLKGKKITDNLSYLKKISCSVNLLGVNFQLITQKSVIFNVKSSKKISWWGIDKLLTVQLIFLQHINPNVTNRIHTLGYNNLLSNYMFDNILRG